MGTRFIQLKNGEKAFNDCLKAIEDAFGNSELWVEPLKKSSLTQGRISSSSTVLCHWWQNIKNTNIEWEYFLKEKNGTKYRYENYRGVEVYIYEHNGVSHVGKSVGIPNHLVPELEGLKPYELYQVIEQKFEGNIFGDDGAVLRIEETI